MLGFSRRKSTSHCRRPAAHPAEKRNWHLEFKWTDNGSNLACNVAACEEQRAKGMQMQCRRSVAIELVTATSN